MSTEGQFLIALGQLRDPSAPTVRSFVCTVAHCVAKLYQAIPTFPKLPHKIFHNIVYRKYTLGVTKIGPL